MMARIVTEAELHIKLDEHAVPRTRVAHLSIAETICEATATPPTTWICAASRSSRIGKHSPPALEVSSLSAIFALSPIEVTINRLNLLWGTTPCRCPKVTALRPWSMWPRACLSKAATSAP